MPAETFITDKDPALFAAHSTLAQLGGARFRRMTQAHGFVGCAGGTVADPLPWLQMQLSPAVQAGVGGRVGRQRLRIIDLGYFYKMLFYNPGPAGEQQDLLTLDHVLPAELAVMFTYATGFYTADEAVMSPGAWLAWIRRVTAEQTISLSTGLEPWLRALTIDLFTTAGKSPEFEAATEQLLLTVPT